MKRSVFTFVLLLAACNSKKPQLVVGDNFSVWMPEAPTKAGCPAHSRFLRMSGVVTI
jgi:hypothetical protein